MRETADSKAGFDLGLENLPSLQDVTFLVRRGGAIEADVEEAETALRHAIESHPNHPTLEIYADDAEGNLAPFFLFCLLSSFLLFF